MKPQNKQQHLELKWVVQYHSFTQAMLLKLRQNPKNKKSSKYPFMKLHENRQQHLEMKWVIQYPSFTQVKLLKTRQNPKNKKS